MISKPIRYDNKEYAKVQINQKPLGRGLNSFQIDFLLVDISFLYTQCVTLDRGYRTTAEALKL